MKKKPKPRRWTGWAVVDCKWKTIREVETYPNHLNPIDCPDCEVIKVTIVEQLPTPTKKDNR